MLLYVRDEGRSDKHLFPRVVFPLLRFAFLFLLLDALSQLGLAPEQGFQLCASHLDNVHRILRTRLPDLREPSVISFGAQVDSQ
jgi:hypothetical protein